MNTSRNMLLSLMDTNTQDLFVQTASLTIYPDTIDIPIRDAKIRELVQWVGALLTHGNELITEIVSTLDTNIDYEDVKTVLRNAAIAVRNPTKSAMVPQEIRQRLVEGVSQNDVELNTEITCIMAAICFGYALHEAIENDVDLAIK